MYLRIINKYSVIRPVINAHFHCRLFHLTFNNSRRRVTLKSSIVDSEADISKENIDPSHIVQNSYSNFLGIESDEGAIVIKPNANSKNDLHESMQLTDVKKIYKQKYYRTSFGIIRCDSDNNLHFHGQFDNKNDSMFPHKSSDDSEVTSEFHKLKSNVLGILYKSPIQDHTKDVASAACSNSKEESFSAKECFAPVSTSSLYGSNPINNSKTRSNLSHKPLIDSLHTVSSIENENEVCNVKETQDMSYIDESCFGSLVDKDISNEISVDNTSSGEELDYIDEVYFGHEISTKNPVPHNELNCFKNGVSDEVFLDETKPKEVKSVESFNYLDEIYFGLSKNSLSHSEMNSLKNNLPIDEFYSDENKSQNISLHGKDENTSGINDLKHFMHKEKPDSLNGTNFHALSKSSGKNNTNLPKVLFHNEFKVNDFQLSKINNFVVKNQKNKNLLNHDIGIETSFNDKLAGESSSKMHSNSNVQSLNAKSDFQSDKDSRHIEDIKYFPKNSSSEKEITESENITTAQEFVEKLRKESEMEKCVKKGASTSNGDKLDSKGHRILKNQVLDFSNCTHDEIITILKDNILYSDDNLLVLNKPYSLVIHSSQTTKSPCLSELLDDLAKYIDEKKTDPKLYTVHRLDKETTGCLLLAKNEATADNIKSLFTQRKIVKKYLILTSRIPDPLQGVIDIPVAEGSVDDRKRMVLQPQLPKDMPYRNHSKGGKRAVTHYKVLSVSGSAALVEATPETGIKHQIRVHFGFGLSCPILGDHKYSHLDKLAPQKLQSDLLQKLHVRQSKVRHIPMHLHAQSITIPGYLDGRNLYVAAPLPDHMRKNLKRLKFKKRNKLIL